MNDHDPEDDGYEGDRGLPTNIVEATAQPLYPNPIIALVLCKYTGNKASQPAPTDAKNDTTPPLFCMDRIRLIHPDDECLTYYFMLEASLTNVRDVLTHMSAPIITIDRGELTFRDIL